MILRRVTQHVRDQNWFAVALDFVIVVFGVGAAMLGQQWLSDRQQRADMSVADLAVQSDMIFNYSMAKERLAVADCRKEAQQAVAAQLLEPGENWTPMPRINSDLTLHTALPVVFRSPSRNWGSRVWDAELARGTFNGMDQTRRENLDLLFKQAGRAEEMQDAIYTLQGRLKTLAVATTISQSDRLRYYDVLGEMDDKAGLLELISGQIIRDIETLGVNRLPEILEKAGAEPSDLIEQRNESGRSVYGACYLPQDWPLLGAVIGEAAP